MARFHFCALFPTCYTTGAVRLAYVDVRKEADNYWRVDGEEDVTYVVLAKDFGASYPFICRTRYRRHSLVLLCRRTNRGDCGDSNLVGGSQHADERH